MRSHEWTLVDEDRDPEFPRSVYECPRCKCWFDTSSTSMNYSEVAPFVRNYRPQIPEDCDVAMCKDVLQS